MVQITYTFKEEDAHLKEQLETFPPQFLESVDEVTERIFAEFDWVTNNLEDLSAQAYEAQAAYRDALYRYIHERKNVLLSKEERHAQEAAVAEKRQQYLKIQREILSAVCKRADDQK